MAAIQSLTLTDFRSYERAQLRAEGRSIYLFGPNGAGKTNLLEAVSFLIPGRGLRNASIPEIGRRKPGEAQGRAWSVSALIAGPDGEMRIGTGLESAAQARRTVRIDGESVPPGRLSDHMRLVWLTPLQDRLFLEAAGERRRFFDRLVFAADPAHAARVSAYEKAMRERNALLAEDNPDPVWLAALETRMGEAGEAMTAARREGLNALQTEIAAREDRPFPQAKLAFGGDFGAALSAGEIARSLAAFRARDATAGRALFGPHRGDLEVVHAVKMRPAAECSTGEQKALILNLVLAQAARLSASDSGPNPVLLLDEVAAHLDQSRRAALFDEIEALGLQVFLTGTDQSLFEGLKGRALGVRVEDGRLTHLEE